MLQMNVKKLQRWRVINSFVDPGMNFDDAIVDEIIKDFKIGQPYIGEIITIAHVRGNYNIRGTRRQFRESIHLVSIHRVDPEGLAIRREFFGRVLKDGNIMFSSLMRYDTWMDGIN